MKMKPSPRTTGFLQALGIGLYISLVAVFMSNAGKVFGSLNNVFGPIIALTLLSVSVLFCALIVLYNPYKSFIEGKKKEALETVIYTAIGLFILLVLFLIGILIFR